MSKDLIYMILYGFGMFVITLIIQFFLFKKNKNINFWSGTEPVFILCILGLMSYEAGDIAGILGYVIGDHIGKYAGWHKSQVKSNNNS